MKDKYVPTNSSSKDAIFPKGVEIYEAKEDVELYYILHYRAPYTIGEKCMFPKRERLIICPPIKENPMGVYCFPVEYEKMEEILIPRMERTEPAYSNYSLFVDTEILNSKFIKLDLMSIQYIKGNATQPIGRELKVIAHVCNDIGGWGKGFVTAISSKWNRPEQEYRKWFKSGECTGNNFVEVVKIENRDKASNELKFKLGNVQFVKVGVDIWIANMIAQKNIRKSTDGLPPIRYEMLSECLTRVREFAKRKNASVHMPRVGTGLAGGSWEKIEPIINHKLIAHEIETFVYDLK